MRLRNGSGKQLLSLRSKLVLGGLLILLIPSLTIGAITFLKSSRSLEDIARRQTMQAAQGLADMFRIALERDLKTVQAVASDARILEALSSGQVDEGVSQRLFDFFKVIGSDYEGLTLFNKEGIVCADALDQGRIGLPIPTPDYFRIAMEGRSNVGKLVFSSVAGQPVFIICAPVFSTDGKPVGGVLGVVKASSLMQYMASISIGKSGYAMMLNQDGVVVTHPNEAWILSFNNLKNSELQQFSEQMLRTETGSGVFTYQGIEKIVGFATVGSTGWKIVVTQHKSEVLALAYANRSAIFWVSGIFIGMTVLIVLFLTRSVGTPLQNTLATLNHAISQAAEAVVIIGPDRKVQFVNPAMAAIIDRQVPDLIGRPFEIDGTDPEDIWAAVLAKRKWAGRILGGRSDSSRYTLDFTITPVLNGNEITCFLGIGRDMSQELALQERIRQSEKMEAIGTLAGGIAHDFNNILGVVFGYTELALDCLEDPKKTGRYLTSILSAAKRARELVNHILTFSRRNDSELKPVIPKYVVKEALGFLRASLPATIEIQEELATSAAILGDSTQFHQVVVNLCTNAGYAMKEKGGALSVILEEITAAEDAHIPESGFSPGRYIRLKISDTGCGIPPETLPRIFDPFFTTKPTGEGTGLGLSVAHGIVKSLNGSITVTSDVGKGTLFTLYLPAIASEAMDINAPEVALPRGTERVMLVDDEPAIVASVEERLTGLGYEVAGFVQPKSALAAFERAPDGYDVVVTDYTMPQMTGYELAAKVREIRPDVPIVLCSGYFGAGEKLQEVPGGVFLKKPVTNREMAYALRQVLSASDETV